MKSKKEQFKLEENKGLSSTIKVSREYFTIALFQFFFLSIHNAIALCEEQIEIEVIY